MAIRASERRIAENRSTTMVNSVRKTHKKSRKGCGRCKRRHIKCDESKPSCEHCITTKNRCSFLDIIPAVSVLHPSTSPTLSNASTTRTPSPPVIAPTTNNGILNTLHLFLLHHVQTGGSFWTTMGLCPSDEPAAMSTLISIGLQHTYLLHEMLSFVSLHLSYLQPSQKEFYRYHATELQMHALRLFNAENVAHGNLREGENEKNDCLPAFFFSAIIGAHNLHDAINSEASDVSLYLDRIVTYLKVAKGVMTQIDGPAWNSLADGPFRGVFSTSCNIPPPENAKSPTLQRLTSLVEDSSSITSSTLLILLRALSHLSSTYMAHSISQSRKDNEYRGSAISALLTWPIRASKEYVELLEQRRPEALAILAWWGRLIEEYRVIWIFGSGGETLVRVIQSLLGSYWEEWLPCAVGQLA